MVMGHNCILELLKARSRQPWLGNYDSQGFYHLTQAYHQRFRQLPPQSKIILGDSEPWEFLAAFVGAITSGNWVFLTNSHWQRREWQQFFALVQPDVIIGSTPHFIPNSLAPRPSNLPLGSIMIPTGGTSGNLCLAIHSWETLTAAVQGLQTYLLVDSLHSFCILPLYHVSGLMQFIRALVTGGNFYLFPYSALKISPPSRLNFQDYCLSLVPTQLQYLVDRFPVWLKQFKIIFLGGAPASLDLLERGRKLALNLALCYGMTETAAQIVTLKPEIFLMGNNSSGQVLPHAQVRIEQQEIIIKSTSLYLGYYPDFAPSLEIRTGDLGNFDLEGNLYILGRKSQVIITGGEKVFPREVEEILLATGLLKDIIIMGLNDNYWGQVVVGVYVGKTAAIGREDLEKAIAKRLAKYKQPKYWLKLDTIPRSAQGKIDYQQLEEIAKTRLCE
jgi:O-succinylbenzoic acid--CoA ligase